jgi:antitoxin (DNA-binding transcriptional repressor) of toxin-antitoxin stability system
MSKMKKVSAREFQRRFGKLTKNLKPGQAIQITKRGEVDGIYQK